MIRKIISTYRDQGHNFEMDIVGETETEYLCKFTDKWKNEFQDGDKVHTIRKCLVGSIYELKEIEIKEQLTLF